VNKLLTTLLSLLFIAHCSFGGQSGFWNETKKIKNSIRIFGYDNGSKSTYEING